MLQRHEYECIAGYIPQSNKSMDEPVVDWFRNDFVPVVQAHLKSLGLPPKAILFLDNAPSHPEEETLKSDDGNIVCRFLPANTTSIIQPMDQGVIEAMKRQYRKKILQKLLHREEDSDLLSFWKKYNLKDAVDNVADSWAEMQPESLSRAWNKLWPQTSEIAEDEGENLTSTISELTSTVFSAENDETIEWLNCDSEDAGYQLLTDDQIVKEFLESESVDEDDDYDGADSESIESTVSATDSRLEAKEAKDLIQKVIEWYQKQDESEMIYTMFLRKIRAFAERKSETALVQTKVSDFYSHK